MTLVGVTCPVCRRGFVVNARGRCTCGACLIRHMRSEAFVTDPERTWVWQNGEGWRRYSELPAMTIVRR